MRQLLVLSDSYQFYATVMSSMRQLSLQSDSYHDDDDEHFDSLRTRFSLLLDSYHDDDEHGLFTLLTHFNK